MLERHSSAGITTRRQNNKVELLQTYLELFTTFFVIGMFTIGGGYAMLSLIQNEVVTVHNWISETTFTDIVAISQMTPGPIGINSATYVGFEVMATQGAPQFLCVLGSFTATFAVVLPSFIIVLALCKVYSKFTDAVTNPLIENFTMSFHIFKVVNHGYKRSSE